ncbi:MAG: HAD family hydrolase, partial [Symbiobacteriaceae bacterium]|nr:HAD family hydrolase [Symbiobacteriaceae bacterium]
TDLDGSLFRDDKSISQRSLDTLTRCRKAGIRVVYATGRTYTVEALIASDLFDGRIMNNGATALCGEEVIFRRMIPWQASRDFLITCADRGLSPLAQQGHISYTNYIIPSDTPTINRYQLVDFATHQLDAEKILLYVNSAQDVEFITNNLPADTYCAVTRWNTLDIMHTDASKSKALAALAHHLGIHPTEIVAFGDDVNDLDMLSFAGISVAMGNALAEVKAAVDQVCEDNENDGIARWLEENVLR